MQTLDEYREEIIRNMRSVGTSKDSFANTVDAYARAILKFETKANRFVPISHLVSTYDFRLPISLNSDADVAVVFLNAAVPSAALERSCHCVRSLPSFAVSCYSISLACTK